jgi:hypothetical protein
MRFFVLSLLWGIIAASPVDYLLVQTDGNSLETGASGWYDPRILGGRFLDVRLQGVFAILCYTDWPHSSPPKPRGNL